MRRAAAGAGDGVPGRRHDFAGGAGAGVAEDDCEAWEVRDVYGGGGVGGGWEGDVREVEVGEVVAEAVVDWFGKVGGEGCICDGGLC